MNFLRTSIPLLLAGALVASGQTRRGPQGPPPHNPGLNMAAVTVVEGAVTSVDIAAGARYPTLAIGQAQIKVGPAWYLLDNDIEIATGDKLKITAAPSADPADKYLYALEIAKGAATLKLRDEQGLPLWMGGPAGERRGEGSGRNGNGIGECAGCLDAASAATVTGTVDKITAAAGIQFPTLVLQTSEGKLLTMKVGPERVLLAADFEIAAGQKLTVRYAQSACRDELVALELTDSAGRKIVLRNADGSPAWN